MTSLRRKLPTPASCRFGARLKAWRQRRKLTQTELAVAVGLSQHAGYQTIVLWESGKRAPDVLQFEFLCRALQCRPGLLLETTQVTK